MIDEDMIEKAAPDRTPILARLIRLFHYNLNHDHEVRNYLLENRRLKPEIITRFQLGAFPSLAVLTRRFSEFELLMSGVVRREEDGTLVSKFNLNRLIIPIFDHHDRPVALIGRVVCNEVEREKLGVPKYDNTVYAKSNCLYGLNLAKSAIKAKGAVLVVEGNMDVISAVQAGTENVVGSSGAFFHSRQIALVSRYADRIWLGLDADEAGERAVKRVLSRPCPEGVVIKQKRVPAGFKDWDEYFRSRS